MPEVREGGNEARDRVCQPDLPPLSEGNTSRAPHGYWCYRRNHPLRPAFGARGRRVELSEKDVREYAEKIKTLVEADQEEVAIDLVRSLNAPRLFAELLRGCSISPEPTCKINLSSWLKDDRHFFLNLIGHCPEKAEIDASLRRENVTKLALSSCKSRTNLDGFSGFTNLEFFVS